MRKVIALVVLALASLLEVNSAHATGSFFLHDGDRVCFYGDSITEQRFYAVAVETYVLTRFPKLKVDFVDSGVGADRVGGGWSGNANLRLKRDVYPFKPNVVTIMLAMNDAGLQPFNQHLFDIYKNGYEQLVATLQQHLPGVRIVIIGPSPYDDCSQKPLFPGGYNGVLQRYDQFDKHFAASHHLEYVDFNAPMVAVIKKLLATQPQFASQVIPGRVHPSAAGQLIMAAALLKYWGGPATVSRVSITGSTVELADNTHISNLQAAHNSLSWTQHDHALPFPMLSLHEVWPQIAPVNGWQAPKPHFNFINAPAAAIIQAGHLYRRLDQEILKVQGLSAQNYTLSINGQHIGTFSAAALAHGINLARYRTPMLLQAYHVLAMAWNRTQARFYAWRDVQLPIEGYTPPWPGPDVILTGASPAARKHIRADGEQLARAIYAVLPAMLIPERDAAKPLDDHYELTPEK